MNGTKMEAREEELEKGLQEVGGRVSMLDSKLGSLVQLLEKYEQRFDAIDEYIKKGEQRFEAIDGYLMEFRRSKMKETKGKAVEQGFLAPEVITEGTKERNRLEEEEIRREQSRGGERESTRRSRSDQPYLTDREFWSRRDFHHRLLELPVFNGNDMLGWVAWIERFFTLNGVVEEEKTSAVLICFEGAALGWLQYREQRRPITSWSEFRHALLQRFGSVKIKSPHEELVSIKQHGLSSNTGRSLRD